MIQYIRLIPSTTEGYFKSPPSTTRWPDPDALLNVIIIATRDQNRATSPVSRPRIGQPRGPRGAVCTGPAETWRSPTRSPTTHSIDRPRLTPKLDAPNRLEQPYFFSHITLQWYSKSKAWLGMALLYLVWYVNQLCYTKVNSFQDTFYSLFMTLFALLPFQV